MLQKGAIRQKPLFLRVGTLYFCCFYTFFVVLKIRWWSLDVKENGLISLLKKPRDRFWVVNNNSQIIYSVFPLFEPFFFKTMYLLSFCSRWFCSKQGSLMWWTFILFFAFRKKKYKKNSFQDTPYVESICFRFWLISHIIQLLNFKLNDNNNRAMYKCR